MQINVGQKIKNRYEILEILKSNIYRLECSYLNKLYLIKAIPKDKNKEGILSNTVNELSSIAHKNILNIKVEEDENYFYMISERDETLDKIDSVKNKLSRLILIECYIQICDAIIYLHGKNIIHGNITPNNILVDRENIVYLLDFGKNYYYQSLDYDSIKNDEDKKFHSPEQLGIIEEKISTESDVFSFGLSMLNLLTDCFDKNIFEQYKQPKDLGYILKLIYDKYINEFEYDADRKLFPLIESMLKENPNERIAINNLKAKLEEIYKELYKQKKKTYLICIYDKEGETADKFKRLNDIASDPELKSYLKNKTKDNYPFVSFSINLKNGNEEINIAIGELIFVCSTNYSKNEGDYFFCFKIFNDSRIYEDIIKNGIKLYDEFDFGVGRNYIGHYDNVKDLINELSYKFKQNEKELERLENDIKSIETEDDLLKAEEKAIEDKKYIKKCQFKSLNKGSHILIFISDNDKFKTKDNVIISKISNNETNENIADITDIEDENIICSGTIEKYLPSERKLFLKIKNETALSLSKNKPFKQNEIYYISNDCKVEEILLNKKKSALRTLKSSNTQISNLITKINEPKWLKEIPMVELDEFYDKNLDENQKLAVIKSMTLTNGSEFMLIQGPPGTGKTTTIVEIIKIVLKDKKHSRILVTSQSNQALDNVLGKVCKEVKVLRIGNKEEKFSEEAKNYSYDMVLNKIIKENLERIKSSKIDDRFKDLQKDFKDKLQNLSYKTYSENNKSTDYSAGELFFKNINVFFGTLLGISSWIDFKTTVFNIAIVDEAGRATLSELLVPIVKSEKFCLVGDHKQLAPVINEEIAQKLSETDSTLNDVKTSFFERIFERMERDKIELFKHTLTTNYRSADSICQIYNKAFYDGILETNPDIKREHDLNYKTNVVIIDTGNLPNKENAQRGTGKINKCNANIIKEILENDILKELDDKKLTKSIGIITPYRAQVDLLEEKLTSIRGFKDRNIEVGTVDSFQGSDRDYIIYDCVRSEKNPKKSRIDFIADEKRLNVSLSRAKELLIIVGDVNFLYRSQTKDKNNPFKSIFDYIYDKENKYKYQIINYNGNNNGSNKNGK